MWDFHFHANSILRAQYCALGPNFCNPPIPTDALKAGTTKDTDQPNELERGSGDYAADPFEEV